MEFLFLSSAFYIYTNLSHMLGDRAVTVKLCSAEQYKQELFKCKANCDLSMLRKFFSIFMYAT